MSLQKTDPAGDLVPSGVGRANGPCGDIAFGRWFRYPAGFSPETLDRSLEAVSAPSGALIVDPFAGVATAGVAASGRGYAFHGIEAHVLIAELAGLKFERPGDPKDLERSAAELIKTTTATRGDRDPVIETPLVESAFPKDVLAELTSLREGIKESESPWRLHLKWALLGSLRDLAVVKVGWPYQLPGRERMAPYNSAVGRFRQRVANMVQDLKAFPTAGSVAITRGDSRSDSGWRQVEEGSAGACVSSPPYLNNFDYADATRLEFYFWGDVRSWQDLTRQVRSEMVRAATHQTTDVTAAEANIRLRRVPKSLAEVSVLEAALAEERARRPRGKEYNRMLACYAADMVDVLGHLFRALRPGAQCGWTIGDSAPYGVYIDTPALIGVFASEIGFEVLRSETIRNRGLRWRSNGSRHQVALCEKLVVFRRPPA